MTTIDLKRDGETLRNSLKSLIDSLSSEVGSTLSAIEIGYDCDQGGWICIHPDRRPEHNRDGTWTNALDDDENVIKMPHWIEAIELGYEGEEVEVIRFDGSTFVIPPTEEDSDPEDEETENADALVPAIGDMIYAVLMAAKKDGMFVALSKFGAVQLDVEEFNGGWAWPEYDELGKTNLA